MDGSLYVGHTNDLHSREQMHNEGRGGSYTAARRPVRIVFSETITSLNAARERERQLKRWSGKKKEALIAGDCKELKRLAKRQG